MRSLIAATMEREPVLRIGARDTPGAEEGRARDFTLLEGGDQG